MNATAIRPIEDPALFSSIEALGIHFRQYISNRYTMGAIAAMELDAVVRRRIDVLFERSDIYRYQGFDVAELYAQILAVAKFLSEARRLLLPHLRAEARAGFPGCSTAERLRRDLIAGNFEANLDILGDGIEALFVKAISYDAGTCGSDAPAFAGISELREIGRLLLVG
jgi:hypothetical protein